MLRTKLRTNWRLWLLTTFVLFVAFGFITAYPVIDVQWSIQYPHNFWGLVSEYVMTITSGSLHKGIHLQHAIEFTLRIAIFTLYFLLSAAVVAWVIQSVLVVVWSWFIKLDTRRHSERFLRPRRGRA